MLVLKYRTPECLRSCSRNAEGKGMGRLNNPLEVQAQSKGSEEAYKACWCFLVTPKYLNSSGRISKDKEKKLRTCSTTKMPGDSSLVALCKGRLTLTFLLSKICSRQACHLGGREERGRSFLKETSKSVSFCLQNQLLENCQGSSLALLPSGKDRQGLWGAAEAQRGRPGKATWQEGGVWEPRAQRALLLPACAQTKKGPPS